MNPRSQKDGLVEEKVCRRAGVPLFSFSKDHLYWACPPLSQRFSIDIFFLLWPDWYFGVAGIILCLFVRSQDLDRGGWTIQYCVGLSYHNTTIL